MQNIYNVEGKTDIHYKKRKCLSERTKDDKAIIEKEIKNHG